MLVLSLNNVGLTGEVVEAWRRRVAMRAEGLEVLRVIPASVSVVVVAAGVPCPSTTGVWLLLGAGLIREDDLADLLTGVNEVGVRPPFDGDGA